MTQTDAAAEGAGSRAAGTDAANGAGHVPAGVHAEVDALATERVSERYADLDTLSTAELVAAMNAEDRTVADAVHAVEPAIVEAVDAVAARMARGGRILTFGAGTPGRLGVLDASEIPPTFGLDPEQVVGVIAGGDAAIRTAAEGAEDDAELGAADAARNAVGPDDSVVGISASGRTPYVLGAIREAASRGALTIGLACNAGAPLGEASDIAIEPVVGPELVSGSTRLKAGTAQKMVLNMLSTLVMVRRGKTYGSLMVDLQITNEKLQARAERTVMRVTGCDQTDAARALDDAEGNVKTAILARSAGIDAAEAGRVLERCGGFLREALRTLGVTEP